MMILPASYFYLKLLHEAELSYLGEVNKGCLMYSEKTNISFGYFYT